MERRTFWKLHGGWLVGVSLAALIAGAWTFATGSRYGRWPGGGSLPGLVLGSLAGLIFVFEMALVAKKTRLLRTARWSLSAQTWMKAHIWLGLLTVPLVLLHSGGRLGGMLTTVLVLVFATVIGSGLWGLALQNVLPRLLLEAAPAETIDTQIDAVGRQHAAEARRLVLVACGGDEAEQPLAGAAIGSPSTAIYGMPRRVGSDVRRESGSAREPPRPVASSAIHSALAGEVVPFLETGQAPRGLLGARQRNEWYFDDLRLRVAPELRGVVDRLQALCEQRRQLNVQRRLHFWLHNWLWVHLPLSAALLILLAVHIVFALRFG